MRKWRDVRSLYFLILSIHFLYQICQFVTFCRKILNTALLACRSQITEHTRYEEIILGRNRCNEAPQVVPAWFLGFFLYKEVCLS